MIKSYYQDAHWWWLRSPLNYSEAMILAFSVINHYLQQSCLYDSIAFLFGSNYGKKKNFSLGVSSWRSLDVKPRPQSVKREHFGECFNYIFKFFYIFLFKDLAVGSFYVFMNFFNLFSINKITLFIDGWVTHAPSKFWTHNLPTPPIFLEGGNAIWFRVHWPFPSYNYWDKCTPKDKHLSGTILHGPLDSNEF